MTSKPAKKKNQSNVVRTYDNNGFKMRAGCICFKDESQKEVLLVTSSANNELWIVPAGGIDPGETSEEAAVREVYEEAGVVGKLGKCLGVFQNDTSKTKTFMYTMIVKNLVEPKESKERKWFVLKEAIAKLNHRPVQQSYLTSVFTVTPTNSTTATTNNTANTCTQNTTIKEPKVNNYSISNLFPNS